MTARNIFGGGTAGRDRRGGGARRRWLPARLGVTVAMVVSVLVGVPAGPAGAAPLNRSASPEAIANAGENLRQRLGAAFGGYWLDEATGQLVVGTTNPGHAAAIAATGGVPRGVTRSAAALEAAKTRLDANSSAVPASVASWRVDLPTNSVVVETVGADPAAAAFAAAGGDGVRIVRVSEAPRPFWDIEGGQYISSSGNSCSVGFNAIGAGGRHLITAGHCTRTASSWSGVGGTLGTVALSSFPTDDYGIIRVASAAAISTPRVMRYSSGTDVTVHGSVAAAVGAQVCRSGRTTGWRCGTVQARGMTVNYTGYGTVYGLTRTIACAEPGDSGGAFVSAPATTLGAHAQGMTSGGSGNCVTGGITYFQPVAEALQAFGLQLVTG